VISGTEEKAMKEVVERSAEVLETSMRFRTTCGN